MALDPSISLNAKAPPMMENLSSLLDMGAKAQALKKAKATYQSDVSQRAAESSQAQTQADIAQQTAPAQIQQMQAAGQQALLALNDEQRKSVGTFITAQAGNDPDVVRAKLDALAEFQPQLKPAIDYAWTAHLAPLANNKAQFGNAIKQVGLATMSVPEQFQARTAQGPMVSNNQQAGMVNQNPAADIPVGQVAPGTGVQMQIPVGTQVFNPNTNAPALVAPGGGAGPQAGPALGATSAAESTVAPVAQDWQSTIAQGTKAQQNIGVLQNIKQFAKGASVSVGSDRRTFINGLAGLIGLDAGEVAKTDTDLLAKNANMLALTGGNTDAARALAEMANPNVKMTESAIREAADQVIGQQKIALAKQQFLQQYAGNPQAYSQKLTQFNQVADPRTFEFASKEPDERRAMLSRMSPADKAQLKAKMEALHNLGITP